MSQLLMGVAGKLLLKVSAIGRDRPGVVFKLAKLLKAHDGNIVFQRSMRVWTDFAIIVIASFEHANESGRAAAESELRAGALGAKLAVLTETGNETDFRWKAQPGTKYQISVGGDDQVGIVELLTSVLFQHGLNIESMDSQVSYLPEHGTLMFESTFEFTSPPSLNMQEFENDVSLLEKDTGLAVAIKPK